MASDAPHGPALRVIMVGDDEDGQPVVKLAGSREAVSAAAALFLQHVRLVPVVALVADDATAQPRRES